jgi:hypothetical protein
MKAKIIGIISLIAVLVIAGVIYFQYFFVFGEGVKAGELNYMVHKGYIFKTYEGKLIQAGFRAKTSGVQSHEFDFSVTNKELAERLMLLGGQNVELHYKEYFGALPWRGFTKFVVDSIVSSRPIYYQPAPVGVLPFGEHKSPSAEITGEEI